MLKFLLIVARVSELSTTLNMVLRTPAKHVLGVPSQLMDLQAVKHAPKVTYVTARPIQIDPPSRPIITASGVQKVPIALQEVGSKRIVHLVHTTLRKVRPSSSTACSARLVHSKTNTAKKDARFADSLLTLVKVWRFASAVEPTEHTRLETLLAAARVVSITSTRLSSPKETLVI
jgi:hypothetical protein